MDGRTVMAWMQVAIGVYFLLRALGHWRTGRAAWKDAVIPGVLSSALGVQILTSGWVRSLAWGVLGVGGVFALARMFAVRDRFGWWSNVVFCALAMPIVIIELMVDDLSGWQQALFAGAGAVFATLAVMTIVRLTRSYKRVALPSA